MKTLFLILTCAFFTLHCGAKPYAVPPEQRAQMEKLRVELQNTLGGKYHEPVAAATTTQLKRGSALYKELCAACHGVRGDGKIEHPGVLLQQPSDFTDETQATFFSEQARLHIIRKGVPGTAMMGWADVLPEEDILALYMYARHLYQSKPSRKFFR